MSGGTMPKWPHVSLKVGDKVENQSGWHGQVVDTIEIGSDTYFSVQMQDFAGETVFYMVDSEGYSLTSGNDILYIDGEQIDDV